MPQGRPRDNQRQRLYAAEEAIANRRPSRYARRHLLDTQHVSGWRMVDPTRPEPYEVIGIGPGGVEVPLTAHHYVPMKAPTVAALTAYIRDVQTSAPFLRRWGWKMLWVQSGRGSNSWAGRITVAPHHRRSEAIILHELAHCLVPTSCQDHGPEFAATLLELVRIIMGPEHARDLRASFTTHRVRVARGWVPKPSEEEYAAAKRRAEEARPRWAQETRQRPAAKRFR